MTMHDKESKRDIKIASHFLSHIIGTKNERVCERNATVLYSSICWQPTMPADEMRRISRREWPLFTDHFGPLYEIKDER